MGIACAFAGFAVIAILIRLMAGSMDDDRVERYIAEKGGQLISKQWDPFGKGWFGEKDSRIYSIQYLDADGNTHDATVKTSMFSGVYFTEDQIVAWKSPIQSSQSPPVVDDPISEIERLREENRRLKEQLDQENR